MSRNVDLVKLWALLFCFVACLSTLLTTTSFELGSQNIPRLAPSASEQWCYNPRAALRTCQNSSSKGCRAEEKRVLNCQSAVKKAYRYMNLGGCLRQNQILSLCRAEWCTARQAGQCEQECAEPKLNLEQCIKGTMKRYMDDYGVSAGTSKDSNHKTLVLQGKTGSNAV